MQSGFFCALPLMLLLASSPSPADLEAALGSDLGYDASPASRLPMPPSPTSPASPFSSLRAAAVDGTWSSGASALHPAELEALAAANLSPASMALAGRDDENGPDPILIVLAVLGVLVVIGALVAAGRNNGN